MCIQRPTNTPCLWEKEEKRERKKIDQFTRCDRLQASHFARPIVFRQVFLLTFSRLLHLLSHSLRSDSQWLPIDRRNRKLKVFEKFFTLLARLCFLPSPDLSCAGILWMSQEANSIEAATHYRDRCFEYPQNSTLRLLFPESQVIFCRGVSGPQ